MRLFYFVLLALLVLLAPVRAETPPRILILLDKGFNGDEMFGPSAAFRAAGYELVVTSPRADKVPLRLTGEPNHWDVPVDLALSAVAPDDFFALYVPGGYSPGFLENNPEAVALVQTFLDAGKPVGMVCHAPRVLLSNDLMGDRTWTGLFTLPDELADLWIERPGRYLDQPVIRDGNLITSRYPLDMGDFAYHFLRYLEAEGGLRLSLRVGRGALVLSDYPEGWGNWHFFSRLISAASAFGLQLERAGAHAADWTDRVVGELDGAGEGLTVLALSITPEHWEAASEDFRARVMAHPHVIASEDMRALLKDREGPVIWVPSDRSIPAWTKALQELPEYGTENPLASDSSIPPQPEIPAFSSATTPEEARVILALREGFDDDSVAVWLQEMVSRDLGPVLLVAHETGPITGRNGLTLEASMVYPEVVPGAGHWIVAPGFFWPQYNPHARQATQPEWIQEQEARDAARMDWILQAREGGSLVFLAGLDALRAGRMDMFAGKHFSSSAQTRWSFGRGAGSFTDDPVTLTDDRLITLSGKNAVAEAIRTGLAIGEN